MTDARTNLLPRLRSGDIAENFRFTCGEHPGTEGRAHMATYSAFQAYSIAKQFGIPFHFSAELIAGLNEHVVPRADEWRQWGVFPPAIEAPAGTHEETRLSPGASNQHPALPDDRRGNVLGPSVCSSDRSQRGEPS